MSEDKNLKSELQFLECPYCKGQGIIAGKKCPKCNGLRLVAWTGDKLLYWGKIIDTAHIYQEKIKKTINNTINFSLLAFGCLGAILFLWQIFLKTANNPTFYKYWEIQSWQMFIFWLSLISDSYLFYRFQNEFALIKKIPKQFIKEAKIKTERIGWETIKNLHPAQKIDISELFSTPVLDAVNKTWNLGKIYSHAEIGAEHLFVSLLAFPEISSMFIRMSISFDTLKNKLTKLFSKYQKPTGIPLSLSIEAYKILFEAYFEAWQIQRKKVQLTELLIATVKQSKDITDLLYDLKVDLNEIKNVALWVSVAKQLKENYNRFRYKSSFRPKSTMNRSMTAAATPFLDSFGTDLTLLAKLGYLAPCVGREKEIKEIFQIIEGGNRTSVLIVGNPGVGKRTIANGIAQLMVAENVPTFLSDKRLVSLSTAKIISGVSASEAQQRLLIVLNEIARSGNIALFIHDIVGMVGITPGGAGSTDLSDVLAQALSKNQFNVIATATPQDYSKYIEGKSTLDEVLERLEINEPKGNSAIQILEAKAGPIEYKYGVYFSYDAIARAVELSDRYLHDRFLPEKAIEVIEETANLVSRTKGKNVIISDEDIAVVISEKTKIPLTEITKEESKKLLNLEQEIHKRLVDQKEAVEMVASALRRARAEIREGNRPIANFLFLGPTGVGKTELAKTVTETYFGSEGCMIRLDMSEYQNKTAIHQIIGIPGSDQGGYLTEHVRKNPFSLVLLDEIEKAHPDILNLFLQVMDDGRLTDTTGRTVDFTNTIIIATSNAGSISIQKMVKEGMTAEKIKNKLYEEEINNYFRPEFLNRMDGVIIFKPLTIEHVNQICRLMLKKVAASLEPKGITLEATDDAIAELSAAGFDPQFGARPLRRVIQEQVSNVLANYLLAGKLDRRDKIILNSGNKIEIVKSKKN